MRIASSRLILECIAAAALLSLSTSTPQSTAVAGGPVAGPGVARATFSPYFGGGVLAHPRDWVRIDPSTPLTVPAGKVFVLTALGENVVGVGAATLRVNGVTAFASSYSAAGAPSLAQQTMADACTGFQVRAGDVVSVDPGATRAWGYLADPAAVGQPSLVVPPMASWLNITGSYVVPQGKILVLTALGTGTGGSWISIDGVRQLTSAGSSLLPRLSLAALPLGLAAGAGQTVAANNSFELIAGFLVDA